MQSVSSMKKDFFQNCLVGAQLMCKGLEKKLEPKLKYLILSDLLKLSLNSDEYLYHPLQTYIWLKFSFINFIIKEFRFCV
ncbi:hypothetical protein Avbf_04877 [Armadillidium vulgare]|nr:hypothetical protein Avbf_04877 [Armadillidium vulgare]